MENHSKDEELKNRKHQEWDIRPYLAMGLTIFLVIALSMILFFLLFRFKGLFDGIGRVINSLQAVVIGCIIAYLVNPIVKWFESKIKPLVQEKSKHPEKVEKTARGLSIAATLTIVIVLIALLMELLIPRLVESLLTLSQTMPFQMNRLVNWASEYTENNAWLSDLISDEAGDFTTFFQNLIQKQMPNWLQNTMESLTSGIASVISLLLNIIIGFIVSIYVLFDKEKFICQGKKLVFALFGPKTANVIVDTIRKGNEIFIGFIVGRVLDSLIIGCLTAVVLTIMQMPHTLIVSVIVGITNVIPFFGPIIGAVPSVILIMMVDPVKGIYFLIIILIIQQIDGNIIGPKILGTTVGVSPFWIIVSVLLGTGLFGIVGMLAGVPLFAVCIYILTQIVNYILKKKNLPQSSKEYRNVERLDPNTGEIIWKKQEEAIGADSAEDEDKAD